MPSRSLKEVALSVEEVAFCSCSHAFTLHTQRCFLEQCLVIIVASRCIILYTALDVPYNADVRVLK